MSTNFQKTPLIQSLAVAGRGAAEDATWQQGKQYPCIVEEVVSPGIVTVNFQVSTSTFTLHNITMPVAKPPYIQYPIKKGDRGFATAADLPLGQMSGLGGGTADPNVPTGNLSALSFVWLGHLDEEFIDPDAVSVYGNVVCTPTELAFYGGSKVTKQSVIGALSAITDGNAKAVLTSLIEALSAMNLIENGTT